MDDQYTAPEPIPRPRSGLIDAARQFLYWLKAVVLRLEVPTPAMYQMAVDRGNTAQEELLRTQVELSVARAALDSAKQQIEIQAEIIVRDRERVHAETANQAARREASVNASMEAKRLRGGDAGDFG